MTGYILLFVGFLLIFAVVTGRGHKLWDALLQGKVGNVGSPPANPV